MRSRNNFARRCCLSQLVIFTTIIFAIARVINTPAYLESSSANRNDVKNHETDSASNIIGSSTVIFSREESSESEPKSEPDTKSETTTTISSTNVTTSTTSNITNTAESNTNNNVTENNETTITVPDECIGLQIVYSENDLYEHSHWWISMTSFEDVPTNMKTCSGSSGWCASLAATIVETSSVKDISLECKDVCMDGKTKEGLCLELQKQNVTEIINANVSVTIKD